VKKLTHEEYLKHIKKHLDVSRKDNEFLKNVKLDEETFTIMVNLNLDAARDILKPLYCPVIRAQPRDPLSMLRSLILMTIKKEPSITKWVEQTRIHSHLAILAGFDPDDTPGIGTYYDFMNRIIDGPYHKPCVHVTKRSALHKRSHLRNLKQKQDDPLDPYHSQSEKLVQELLNNADCPRSQDFLKTLEDIFIQTGLIPTIKEKVLTIDDFISSGDGSIVATNASSQGKPGCSCRSEGHMNCDHPRFYSSPTAQWCFDHHHNNFVFGDRYYILAVTENGHDFPLHVTLPGGNESDFTLSLNALDRFIKAASENGLNMHIHYFCGDGHHDSYAHYHYLDEKNIIPVIPLTHQSEKTHPHFDDIDAPLDTDGTPLCPGGKRMRYHGYNKKRHVQVYACPVKRLAHCKGNSFYSVHCDECPKAEICCPESSLAPLIYIKSDTDPRYFPPLARNTDKFETISNQRSATERLNSVIDSYNIDHRHRNADYVLIRLTCINIVIHAHIRHTEAVKKSSQDDLFEEALEKVGVTLPKEAAKAA
jgi:hypothetical protein